MSNFSINEMQSMQKELQDKYKEKWERICPETGKNKLQILLERYAYSEIGGTFILI